jgi:hypothetical protein
MVQEPLNRKSPEALLDEVKALVSANMAGNAQLLSRVVTLLSNTRHRMAAAPPGRPPDPSAILGQGLELTLESWAIVNQHTQAMLKDLVSAAERRLAVGPGLAAVHDKPLEQQPPLRLEGRQGERVSGRFAVENEYDCPVQVSFAVSGLTPAQGSPLPATHVTLDPVRLIIGPRASLLVAATLDITEDFVVGQTYTATIRVVGFRASDILLQVTVLGPRGRANSRGSPDARIRRPPTRKGKAR